MINGVINVKKEAGFTSHDVVAKLRGILRQKKIGHTGTLDPEAVGVLPVCLGKATKICDTIGNWDKTYCAKLLLGVETDTEDVFGTKLREQKVTVSAEEIREIILSFIGKYSQIPPMYSAKKINGKKLYELAREGKVIERKSCEVEIYQIDIQEIALPYVTFEVTCSKGTYIRSLCRDIGEKAGCGGCMAELSRTRVSDFYWKDAVTLAEIEQFRDQEKLSEHIRSIDSIFYFYPKIMVSKKADKLLFNGNKIPLKYCTKTDETLEPIPDGMLKRYRVYDELGHFIGLYEVEEKNGVIKPDKLFFDGAEKG